MASTSLSPAASIENALDGMAIVNEEDALAGVDVRGSWRRSVLSQEAETRQSGSIPFRSYSLGLDALSTHWLIRDT